MPVFDRRKKKVESECINNQVEKRRKKEKKKEMK